MPDSKDNLITVNVALEVANWLEDETHRRKKAHKLISRSDLIQELIEAYGSQTEKRAASASSSPPDVATIPGRTPESQYPEPHREAHRMLEAILTHGTTEQADWISGNVKTFESEIRLRAQIEEAQGKSVRRPKRQVRPGDLQTGT